MAETKVKAASAASNSAKKTPAKKPAAKSGVTAASIEQLQPDPVLPPTDEAIEAATKGKVKTPKATTPAKPQFPKETYLLWYEQMQLMRKFE